MMFVGSFPETSPLRDAIDAAGAADEADCVDRLLAEADAGPALNTRIQDRAEALVEAVRARTEAAHGLDAFMHRYDLSSHEGVMLMCLAEALLRIPDAATADRLIAEKIGGADWAKHVGESGSLFVNASTWALMLTGRLVRLDAVEVKEPRTLLRRLVSRSGEPLIRQAMLQAMRIIGRQFVIGRRIEDALATACEVEARGFRHTYDMLGESAHTTADAQRYFAAYRHAIAAVGAAAAGRGPVEGPGVSIKLSALHPRFETAQAARVMAELVPQVRALARDAKAANIGMCIDTEEAHRLQISLDVLAAVFADTALDGWEGLGIAVQAYQKRGRAVLDWLAELARSTGRRLCVRLVKGAYWDAEIKRAQELGLDGYPVFTRKTATDVSYLACARRLLAEPSAFRPAFATHNAHTLAAVIELARDAGWTAADFECQRLHGMGEPLYEALYRQAGRPGSGPLSPACRIYGPVGSHEELLAYLVRRLLENGSNTSFVNRLVDAEQPAAALVADPVRRLAALSQKAHPRIPRPQQVYGPERPAARGIDLSEPAALRTLARAMPTLPVELRAEPLVNGRSAPSEAERDVYDPADRRRRVGIVLEAGTAALDAALRAAAASARNWDVAGGGTRAQVLRRGADLLEAEMPDFLALLVREAGKTLPDAVAEVREAADFCRYYATRAEAEFAAPDVLPGPTGESNHLSRHGRGVFACISPWNFPLAIFTGQIAAALAAGNAVVAKPAEQTPLIAAAAVRLLLRAGVPPQVLHLLPGAGDLGAALVADPRIDGVAFTGSHPTAHAINRTLAARPGPIAPLIAETGGVNVMLVDSSALAEQVVADVLTSAFRSAGQRCSALRVLLLQDSVAARITTMLTGAMAELNVGDPGLIATDVGPVIDDDARTMLKEHATMLRQRGRLLVEVALGAECAHGSFFAPCAFAIDRPEDLTSLVFAREVFGPILHVATWKPEGLDALLQTIDEAGYGLTLGIHSRIDDFVRRVHGRLRIGNTYVNRNMIGAVVGVQPFGGERLSGTGPKAGGPRSLHRFAVERTLTINLAAAGGNTQLLSLGDEES